MKTLIALLIVIGSGFVAAPKAEARPHCGVGRIHVSHHTSCGCPVYKQSFIAGYDACGRPIYRFRVLPVNHRCHHRAGWHDSRRWNCGPRTRIGVGHNRWHSHHGRRVIVSPRRCR
jgi:hypothetical protein